ncbi:outer membrane beta-barrel protein [Spirosoma sp. BT702]|uniref:Outer membrane beta-barrel protein n=1 Tax=Spirosoma profusum TaxID=2771354 RepID=A0A926XYE7_9BACT|nr:outer membrane beta-barrel protein [Spirosoma profusum]MBD2703119.1 outer membrane beta-barrel protein [Spirosoma profusum]
MKYNFLILALLVVPFGGSAQTRTAARKPVASASQKATIRSQASGATSTAAKPAPAPASTRFTTEQPAPQAQPVAEPKAVEPANKPTAQPVAERPQVRPVAVAESKFRIGVRLGGNSSTIGGTDVAAVGAGVQLERIMGFHGGLVMNIGGPGFSVQPEILFSQYGARLALGSDYLQIKYNLVEVPVLLKASFGQPNLRFFVNAGPVGTYAVSGTVSVREGGQSDSQTIDMSQQGRFNYGVSGGAGVALKAGPGTVLLEGRYSYLVGNEDKTTPQAAMLSFGYLIPMGGR